MPKATIDYTPADSSRRRFLAITAAASAVSAGALAVAAMPVQQVCAVTPEENMKDPIHAAIESHAAALRAQLAHLGRLSTDGQFDENESQYAAFEAAEEAALALVTVKPTTIAGLARLLRHVSEYEAQGNEWPTFQDDETDMGSREFAFFLHRNLAAALTA